VPGPHTKLLSKIDIVEWAYRHVRPPPTYIPIFSRGLPRPYFRVHPPLLFGTVGILVCTRGILGDVVTLRRCARRCRFLRKASRKPACSAREYLHRPLIWSASDLSRILHGNRHCIHRARYQHRSGVVYPCVKKQHYV